MSNAIIGYTNLVDTALEVRASSSELLLPVSNLLVPHVARKWRGLAGNSDYVVIDFGAPTYIGLIGVFGITGTQARIRLSTVDTTGGAGDAYDTGTVVVDQAYLSTVTLVPGGATGRYLRVDITTAGDFVEIGRVFAGMQTEFSYNYVWNAQWQWNDRSTRTKTRGGQTQISNDVTYRTLDVTFDFLTKDERDGFIETIDRVNGMKTDVLFVAEPDSTNLARDSIWGLVTTITPVVAANIGIYSKQFQFEERL